MYLYIDNSKDENIEISYSLNTTWVQQTFSSGEFILLQAIEKVLADQNMKSADLKGLAVVVGKGRFTATRVAATVANTLAYALKIPVLAVNEMTSDLLDKLKSATPGIYISAQYSGEANIGIKKQLK